VNEKTNILAYSSVREEKTGDRFEPAWLLLWVSGAFGVIGVLITITAVVLHAMSPELVGMAAMIGAVWLMFGGVVTLILAILALAGLIHACFFPVDRRRGILCALTILLGVLANFPLAALCIRIGLSLVD